jgi:flagellar motor switch protein FliG
MATAHTGSTSNSKLRKAAIVLVSLGEQIGAELLKRLPESDVQRVSDEVARLGAVSADEAEAILREFYMLGKSSSCVGRGGFEYTRKMLVNAFGPESGASLFEGLRRGPARLLVNVESLEKTDPEQLARFIRDEHPQTIALLLSQFKPSQAAAVLSALPPDLAADTAYRIAKLERITPEVVDKVAGTIGRKLSEVEAVERESCIGMRAVSDLFNHLAPEVTDRILEDVAGRDQEVATSIRHLLFVFEDLLLLDKNGIKELLGRIPDRKVLTMALKGTSEELQKHILQTMSQSGAAMLREDMEAMGPVKIKDVTAAQQEIIATVRMLEKEGVISIRGGADQYVE